MAHSNHRGTERVKAVCVAAIRALPALASLGLLAAAAWWVGVPCGLIATAAALLVAEHWWKSGP